VTDSEEIAPLEAQLRALGPVRSWDPFNTLRVTGAEGTLWNVPSAPGRGGSVLNFLLPLPAGTPPLIMDVSPRPSEMEPVAETGRSTDLQPHDLVFERRFVVEAAPPEVVGILLDQPTRTALLTLAPCRLLVEGGEIRLTKMGVIDGLNDVRVLETVARIVRLCADTRDRVVRIPVELARLTEADAYRGAVQASKGEARAAAVAALQNLRERRADRKAAIELGCLIAFAVFMTALWFLLPHR
jgi:hypothetical protein